MSHSKRMASLPQMFELLAAIVRQFHKFVDDKIPAERAQHLIEHQDELASVLLTVLLGTESFLFQTLLAACRQSYVNPDFNVEHYPLEPMAFDEAEWEVFEHHFNRTVTGEKAFRRLEKMGYRLLGGSRRAMQFVAAHPDIQRNHPLVVTARWQDDDGHWCAPVFRWYGGKRYLYLHCLHLDFSPDYGWLVLRKRQK